MPKNDWRHALMALWMPGAKHHHLPANKNHSCAHRTRRDGIVFHTAASSAGGANHLAYWSRENVGASSHFYVDYDGTIWQFMPLEETAWTSVGGSWRTIGVETQGQPSEPWTPAQVDALARIVKWASSIEGWPIQKMRSTSRSERGIGWHNMPFGGEQWNPNAHYCPGRQRVTQIDQVVSKAKNTTPQKEGFLMALSDAEQKKLAARTKSIHDILTGYGENQYVKQGMNFKKVAEQTNTNTARIRNVQDIVTNFPDNKYVQRDGAIGEKLDAILDAVGALTTRVEALEAGK